MFMCLVRNQSVRPPGAQNLEKSEASRELEAKAASLAATRMWVAIDLKGGKYSDAELLGFMLYSLWNI